MDKFQYIYNNGVTTFFIEFTIGTSYIMNGVGMWNVSGQGSNNKNYTATMTRSPRGEFLIQNLQQV